MRRSRIPCRFPIKFLCAAAMLVAVLVVVVGCASEVPESGANAVPTATPMPEPTAIPLPTPTLVLVATPTRELYEILQPASERLETLQHFRFRMTHENGSSPMAFGLQVKDVVGQFTAPDSLKADIGAWVGGYFFTVSLVSTGQETYLANPFTDEYEQVERGIISSALLDPVLGISGIMRNTRNPVLEGEADLAGVSTYYITSTIDSGQLTSISPFAEPGHPIRVAIWIGKADLYIYKIRLEGRLSNEEDSEVVRTIFLSDFNRLPN